MEYRIKCNNITEGELIVQLLTSLGYKPHPFDFDDIDTCLYIAVYDDMTYVYGTNMTVYGESLINLDDFLDIIEQQGGV